MARKIGKLSPAKVAKATKPGVYGDGGGLSLRVSRGAGRSWVFRYQKDGRTHELGLGPAHLVTLAQAREKAREQARLILDGGDPIARREAAKSARTFEACASAYIEAHAAGWRSAVHAAQWRTTLATYTFPTIGQKSVRDVALADVLACLKPLWPRVPETASRLRGRIESILDYAAVNGWRTGDNPARWKGNLAHLLPAKAKVAHVRHFPAVPWRDIGEVMASLALRRSMAALALRFLILTASRSGEVRGATWPEIDMAEKTWTVPGSRMKAGRAHRVPLSEPALAILSEMELLRRKPDGLVFPGRRGPLSDAAMNRLIPAGATVHGFRSTFRDWASETGQRADLAEAALAHVTGSKTVQAYLRGDLFEARRALMADWTTFCLTGS